MTKDKDGKDKEKIIKFSSNTIYIPDGSNPEILRNVFGSFSRRPPKAPPKLGSTTTPGQNW